MIRRTSTKGLLALINHEGVVLSSYRDSVGVWTIGVGHTAGAGAPKPVQGMRITLERAVDIFRQDIVRFENGVNRAVKVPLQQHEFDALVSFHFNTGGIFRAHLTKSINAGDMDKAASQFMGWKKPKSIIGRRKKEQALFATGDYGNITTAQVYDKLPGKARAVSTAVILGKSVTQPDKPEGTCDMATMQILMQMLNGMFTNAGSGSWLGRLLMIAGIGEGTGTVDIVGADMTGLPWWAIAVMAFFWLRSEKQDFDHAGLAGLMSGKASDADPDKET